MSPFSFTPISLPYSFIPLCSPPTDLAAAQEHSQDSAYEAKVIAAASTLSFWAPFVDAGAVDAKQRGALVDWITAALEGHNQQDYLDENGPLFVNAFVSLLSSSKSSPHPETPSLIIPAPDVAVSLYALLFRTDSNPIDDAAVQARASLFRSTATTAWDKALDDPRYAELNARVAADFHAAAAKTAAAAAELEITGHKVEADMASAAVGPSSPRLAHQQDLSKLGPLRDDGVFQSLLTLISRADATGFQQRKGVAALATITAREVSGTHPVFRHLFRWLSGAIAAPQTQLAALTAAKGLLKNKDLHLAFEAEQAYHNISTVLKRGSKSLQPLYLAGFCTWLLTFNPEMDHILHAYGVVASLASVLKVVVREKVVRIALATLTSLLGRGRFTEEMVGVELHHLAPQLAARKWKDADITADAEKLCDVLNARIAELSSFELYVAELQAGALRKSPVHNEKFWRTNALKFDDGNFVLIGTLISQLDGDKEEALEMACYDLGEFARFHPDGKRVVSRMGGKSKLMELMTHKDAAVAKAALLAVQKVLVQKWDQMVASAAGKISSVAAN